MELLDAKIEKQVNSKYNENEYLDSLILENVKNSKIIGDIAIVDGYAFSLDRSVPKIGEYVGKETELVFPDLSTSVKVAEDCKSATIAITTKEEQNGINKIEILQDGNIIKEYTYENAKEEITENYVTKQNGKYIIKVYSKLSVTQIENVEGMIAYVEYSPNGNNTYQKQHSVKILTDETNEKITEIKYQWLQTTVEPAESTFSTIVKSGETITKSGVSGIWYLWTLATTESGETRTARSEAFYFDNEGPTISAFTATKYSETGITVSATAIDQKSGTIKFVFYVDNVLKKTITCTATTSSVTKTATLTGLSTGSHTCKVIVYDNLNNSSSKTISGTTKLYTWERYSVNETTYYVQSNPTYVNEWKYKYGSVCRAGTTAYSKLVFDNEKGYFYYNCCTIANYGGNWARAKARDIIEPSGPGRSSSTFCCVNRIVATSSNNYIEFNIKVIKAEKSTTYSKGVTQYSDVTSTSSSAYPTNAKSGSYWYVYKGLT